MTTTSGIPTQTGQRFTGLPNTAQTGGGTLTDAQMQAVAMQAWQSTPKLQSFLTKQYGYIGSYFESNPELLPIIVTAGYWNWDQAQLDAALTQTTWWKQTSQAARNFQEIQANDPGTAAQMVAQQRNVIVTAAQSLGIALPDATVTNLATMAVKLNWTSDTITQTLRQGSSKATPSPQFGQAATFADQARQLAGEYAVNLTTTQLGKYVQQSTQGKLTADGLQNLFAQQASVAFPWMKTAIKEGVTPAQFLSQYASAAGQTLGVDPSSVLWTDPKYMKALMTDQNGQSTQQPVSVGLFQQNLMRTPGFGYQYTQGARDQAYAVATKIVQTFGKVKG